MNADIEFYEIYNSIEINNMMNGYTGILDTMINTITLDYYLYSYREILSNITSFYTLYILNAKVTWYLTLLIPLYFVNNYSIEKKFAKIDSTFYEET